MYFIRNGFTWSRRLRSPMICLPSVTWRSGKTSGVNSKFKGLRIMKGEFSFLKFPLSLFFVQFSPSVDWMMPTHMGRATHFPELINSNTNLIQKHPKITFNLGTSWPVKFTYKINHHNWSSFLISQCLIFPIHKMHIISHRVATRIKCFNTYNVFQIRTRTIELSINASYKY